MTSSMFGALLLLAASATPAAPTAALPKAAVSRRVSATATARIRIISGVRFGENQSPNAAGADRRKAQLADADGLIRPAEFLEFQ
jgi:hypothetical protein